MIDMFENMFEKRNNCKECENCLLLDVSESTEINNLKYYKANCSWSYNVSTVKPKIFCKHHDEVIPVELLNKFYCDFMKKNKGK